MIHIEGKMIGMGGISEEGAYLKRLEGMCSTGEVEQFTFDR